MLEQNASLSEVALLLEAAIQKGELGEGGYEAWILLGETRNMDEREDVGMKALTEGVRLAEEADANGVGMLVCYLHYAPTCTLLTKFHIVSRDLLHERIVGSRFSCDAAALVARTLPRRAYCTRGARGLDPVCVVFA